MQPIIILSTKRSGSHFLLSLLSANGWTYGDEVFYPYIARKTEPKEIVEQERARRTPDIAYIVHGYQLAAVQEKYDGDALHDCFEPCFYIHLARDMVDMAVSHYFASCQAAFVSWQKSKNDGPAYDYDRIKMHHDILSMHPWREDTLNRLSALRLTYDQLYIHTNDALGLISNHVGKTLTMPTQPLRNQKQFHPLKEVFAARFKEELASKQKEMSKAVVEDFGQDNELDQCDTDAPLKA